jgi:hypothetical protein
MAAGRIPQHRPARIGVRERPGQLLVGVCPIQVQAVQVGDLAVGRVGHDRRSQRRVAVVGSCPGQGSARTRPKALLACVPSRLG